MGKIFKLRPPESDQFILGSPDHVPVHYRSMSLFSWRRLRHLILPYIGIFVSMGLAVFALITYYDEQRETLNVPYLQIPRMMKQPQIKEKKNIEAKRQQVFQENDFFIKVEDPDESK